MTGAVIGTPFEPYSLRYHRSGLQVLSAESIVWRIMTLEGIFDAQNVYEYV